MKKRIINFLGAAVAPAPYPAAAGWHIILFGTIIWLICGCPTSVKWWQALLGAGAAALIGLLLVLLSARLSKDLEAAEAAEAQAAAEAAERAHLRQRVLFKLSEVPAGTVLSVHAFTWPEFMAAREMAQDGLIVGHYGNFANATGFSSLPA